MVEKKEMESLKSAESRNLITVLTCMNSTGIYVQTLIVFLTTNVKARLMNAAPEKFISAFRPRDWIATDIIEQRLVAL
jgi:hypothetical protein